MPLVDISATSLVLPLRELGRLPADVSLLPVLKAYRDWCVGVKLAGTAEPLQGSVSLVDLIRVERMDFDKLCEVAAKTTMEKNKMTTTSEKNTASDIVLAAKLGAKLAIANEAGELVLSAVVAAFPHLEQHFEDPTGRAIGKAVSAIGLAYLAETLGVEDREKINTICNLVVTSSTQELAEDKLKAIRPLFSKLAAIAQNLPQVTSSTPA